MPSRVYSDWETQLRAWHTTPPSSPVLLSPQNTSHRLEALFDDQLSLNRNRLAVQDCATQASLTYAQLNRVARALAQSLLKITRRVSVQTLTSASKHVSISSSSTANTGQPGSGQSTLSVSGGILPMQVKSVPFILVFLDASLRVPVGFLGVLKAGFAVLPLDTETPLDRIRFILNDAGVSVVVTQTKHLELFQTGIMNGTLRANLQVLDIEQGLLDVTYAEVELQVLAKEGLEPAYCMYTSGTTGHPKAVVIPHYAVTHAIRVSLAEYSRDAHRRLSMVSPAFDAAIEDYFGAFASGCTLFVADRVEFTKNPYPYLIQNRIDTFYISPTGLAHIDPDKLSKQRHSLTTIMFGGEVMAPSLLERWIRAFPDVHFFNMYGPTETAIQVSLKRITLKDISKTTSQQSSSAKKMSVGKPYPGVAFYVVDPHHSSHSGKELKLMDRNHMGELLIGGIQVGYGYLNRTIENTEHFLPDPYQWHRLSMPNGPLNSVPPRLYRTGDLVRWNSEGEIEFMGRIKGSFVKVRGCRVELFGVQAILERVPGVMMAVVSVERDSQKLESIVAYVKLKIDVGLKDVAREAKRRLGPHEVPNRYVQVDEFPMSPNGKVDMVALQGGDTESNEITIDAVSPARSHKSRPSPPCTPKSQKQKKHPSVNHLEVSLEEVNSTDVEVIANVLLKKAAIIFERPEIADLSIKVDLVRECGLNSITAVRFCSMVRNMYPTVEVDPHSLIHYARTPLELAGRILFTRISSPSPQMTELVQDQEPVQLSLSRPRPKSYILPDQSALFYGISFYSNYPAWFVNSLRKTLVHRIRLFTTVMLQLPKRDSSDPYFQRIDPIRLHQAVDRLYECHPVLSTQIRPEKKGIALLTKYSRKASLVVRQAPLIVPMETITLAGPEEVKKKMEAAGLKTTSSPFCLAYALDDNKVVMSLHHGISDALFLGVIGRHLQLFYEDPDRKDIPVYDPIDQAVMESNILHLYPSMDKYSPYPCFNFPICTPSFKNNFTSRYWAQHSRTVVSVMCGSSLDTLTEATPLVASAITHSAAYLSQIYRQKHSIEPFNFVAGFNEMRMTHLPGKSGISVHQLCNVMHFPCTSPSMITRSQFVNAYKDRVPHRLDPSERIDGVCNHSLDINIQIDASPRSGAFLTDDYGRLTNTKCWYGPVVSGGMVVDMMVAADMGGIFLSFQVSHSIPDEIRVPFIPLVIQELRSLQLVAYEVAHRD